MGTALRMLVLALLAALSPLALTATILVLKSHLARLNGILFAAGFLLGEAIGWAFALLLGSVLDLGDGGDIVAAALQVLLGALLLSVAWRVHRREAAPRRERGPRTQALLARLQHLNPIAAVVVGTLLGLGIPKRLTITIVAAATLTASDLDNARQLALVALYIVVAAVLVWAPVLVYVVAGARARAWLDAVQDWLASHQRKVTMVSLAAFGTLLVVDGLTQI